MSETKKKATRREVFCAVGGYIQENGLESINGIPVEEILTVLDNAIASIDKKQATAKEKAAEKKLAGDELRTQVEAIIAGASGAITPEEVANAIADDAVTKSVVVAKVKPLVDMGRVVKTTKDVNGKKCVAYEIAQ